MQKKSFLENYGELKKIKQNRNIIIAIGGCMMQEEHITQKIKKSYPFVDVIFGTHTLHKFPEDLHKILQTRKKMQDVIDIDGEVLAVSQFTLAASTKKGNRPSYIHAAGHDVAIPLYEKFCERMQELVGREVKRGVFGADMQVSLINDGPVTIIVDSKLKE